MIDRPVPVSQIPRDAFLSRSNWIVTCQQSPEEAARLYVSRAWAFAAVAGGAAALWHHLRRPLGR